MGSCFAAHIIRFLKRNRWAVNKNVSQSIVRLKNGETEGLNNMDTLGQRVIFTLAHVYEYGENDDVEVRVKELGIYSTYQKAEEAIERYAILPGFNRHPRSCFIIDEYEIDTDQAWTEGFISTVDIANNFKSLTECLNEWLDIQKTVEESWEDRKYYNFMCEIDRGMYELKNADELASFISSEWGKKFPEKPKLHEDYLLVAKKILALPLLT